MSGANADDATPALSRTTRRVMASLAISTIVVAGLVVLVAGDAIRLLDLALLGVVALPTLGLAGAVAYSPHRGRASVCALALLLIAVGILWLLLQAYLLVRR
jgi:hypothetical protein